MPASCKKDYILLLQNRQTNKQKREKKTTKNKCQNEGQEAEAEAAQHYTGQTAKEKDGETAASGQTRGRLIR